MLGTPPAFILSQDQTLVKSVCSVQDQPLANLSLYCFGLWAFALFWIILLNFQGSLSIVQLSKFRSPSRDSYIRLPHRFVFVKNFFQVFFDFFRSIFPALSEPEEWEHSREARYLAVCPAVFISGTCYILSSLLINVNTFFSFFLFFLIFL